MQSYSEKYTGNREFWKTIKPYFSNKEFNSNKYLLFEKDVLVSNKGKIAKKFNEPFINISLKLKLRSCPGSSNKCNTIDKLIEKPKFHYRILKIKQTFYEELVTENKRIIKNGLETISYPASELLSLLPKETN